MAYFKRVFSSPLVTFVRMLIFALCVAGIIALRLDSQNKRRVAEKRAVASRSVGAPREVLATPRTVAPTDLPSEEAVETAETTVDEPLFIDEPEIATNEFSTVNPNDEPEDAVFPSDEVSEQTPAVATKPSESANKVADVSLRALEASVELRTKSISEIRIGDRVPGVNPEGRDGSDEALFASEDLYIFTFRVPKSDGTFCKAKLLRSASWLFDQRTRFASVVDGHEFNEIDSLISERSPYYFDLNFQFEVWLEMPELGCVGWSKVVDVDNSFKYAPGEGNLVVGTFEHVARGMIDLLIEGQDKPIGCTPTHPFWSEDREEFFEVGELFEGERVRVLNGDTKRVVQKLPRPGPEVVYNFEVFGEHVYCVTSDGVLVHNGCDVTEGRYYYYNTEGFKIYKKYGVYIFEVEGKETVLVGAYGPVLKARAEMEILNTEAHHLPQKALLTDENITAYKGTAVNMLKEKHALTNTYRRRPKAGTASMDALKDDIKNLKEILTEEYGYTERQAQSVCRVVEILNKKIRNLL